MKVYFILCVLLSSLTFSQSPKLLQIHSHNDYQQSNPFLGAYMGGANSIEIDVFLKDGALFVTHDESDIVTANDIESMYLKPLQKVLSALETNDRQLQILIDVKSEARASLDRLIDVLKKYPKLTKSEQVVFVISGNRPEPHLYSNYPNYILFDYQSLDELKDEETLKKIALISLSFSKFSSWNGLGELPHKDRKIITETVKKAYRFNRPFRFWGTPDTKLAWETFAKIGIDFINTDKPSECVAFFKASNKK